MLLRFLPRWWRKNIKQCPRLLWEWLHGLDFSFFEEPEAVGLDSTLGHPHDPSEPSVLHAVMRHLTVSPGASLLDVGCGKGAALRVFMDYPFERVDGVDMSERLIATAVRNFARLGRSPRLFVADAVDFDKWDDYTWLYFFNPFPDVVLERVMQRIAESLSRRPRKLTILYCNPEGHRCVAPYCVQHEEYVFHQKGIRLGVFVYHLEPCKG